MEKSKTFFNATLTYFIIFVLFVVIRMLSSFGLLSFGQGDGYLFTFIIQVVLLLGGSLVIFPLLCKTKSRTVIKRFGVKKTSFKVVLLCILLGAVIFFLNCFVSDFFNGIIELFGYEHSYSSSTSYSFGSLVLNIIFSALLPAVCEEIAHRGMLLKSFSPLGAWKAILFSSLLFGLLHVNIEQFFYATLIGVFLGVLTTITNSIVPAMIVHFMNNALSTYRSFSIINGLPFGKVVVWFETIISSNVFLGALLSILLMLTLAYFAIKLTSIIVRIRTREDMSLMQNWLSKQIMREEYLLNLESAKFEATGQVSEGYDPMQRIKNLVVMEDPDEAAFEPPKQSKVLLYVTMIMGGILTLFTFIWGVL